MSRELERFRPPLRRGFPTAFAALLLSLSCIGLAEDAAPAPPAPTKWRISAECRMIVLPQKLALPILAQFSEPGSGVAAWEQTEKVVLSGEAELAADLVVQGAEGAELVTRSCDEIQYPSGYDRPRAPQALLPRNYNVEMLRAWPVFSVAPCFFERRDAGESLEVVPAVEADGRWLDVSVIAQHVRLEHYRSFVYATKPGGEKLELQQPIFSTQKESSNFRLRNGERILLGAHKLSSPEKTFELFLFEARASPAAGDR